MIDINELRAKTLEVQQREKTKRTKQLHETFADLIADTERAMRKAAAEGKYAIVVSNQTREALTALWTYFGDPFKKLTDRNGRDGNLIISWEP